MSTATATTAQTFTSKIDALSLDTAFAALALVAKPKTSEERMVRMGLIDSIESRFPAIAAWVESYYAREGSRQLNYVEALMLAREAV